MRRRWASRTPSPSSGVLTRMRMAVRARLRRGPTAATAAGFSEARLKGRHQIGALARRLLFGFRSRHDVLAVCFSLDQFEHLLAILIVIFFRLELRRQRIDQLRRNLQFAIVDFSLR